jgi:mannosyltransferase
VATLDLARRPSVARLGARGLERLATAPVLVALLTLVSLYLRTGELHGGFWIDEGISVGIAHHHWSSIPGLLDQDGSPPAYYMLLGLWIRLFGDSEAATHTLSLVFGLACVPAAYVAGRVVFDGATGLWGAALTAFNPFLTYYAQETRMYELEALLSFVIAASYVQGVLRGRRAWGIAFSVSTALLAYTHNWGLFLGLALLVATAVCARDALRRLVLYGAGAFVLYAPWLPTLFSQVRHTGAPWSSSPNIRDLILSPGTVLGGDPGTMAFVLAGGTGLALMLRRRDRDEERVIRAFAAVFIVAIGVAWVFAQFTPAWTGRYFAIVFGPAAILFGAGLSRAGRLGAVALVAVLFLWAGYAVKNDKENARQIAAALAPGLEPGELVVSTHPEQVPVLRYYLGPGLRFATTLGPVADQQIFDWRDVVSRLRATSTRARVDQTITSVRPGSEFVVVAPVFRGYQAWKARWTRLVWKKSVAFTTRLQADPRVRLVRHVQTNELVVKHNYFKLLQAFVFRRLR